MAQNITFNGLVYTVPDTGGEAWGSDLTNYFIAIPQGALQKSGGTFTLSNDVNFGATYGLLSSYFKSRGANASSSGLIRLNLTDTIAWRNNANNADLALAINGSDQLTFNGLAFQASGNYITALTGDVTAAGPGSAASLIAAHVVTNSKIRQSAALSILGNATNAPADISDISAGSDNTVLLRSGTSLIFNLLTNNNVSASAAIAYSKLNLTGSILNADISASAAIAYSKLALTGSILNADLAGSIAASKLIGTDIATVGTITSGTWSGTTIALNKGGTGQTTKAAAFDALSPNSTTGDLTYYSGSTNARLAVGASGTVMKSVGGIPTWSAFSGGINYASSNPDAEADTSGWATYADGAAIPVDGTGGSPSGTFTRSTSSPLRGSASFLYTAGALGNGASYAFTIDSADQAKRLTISFDWSVGGTVVDGDYTIYVYDVTNAVLTQVIPYTIGGAVSGTQYAFKGTYQTASNSTSYRLVINQAVASPGGNLKLDNIYIGPQGVSYTTPVTDWIAYTPSYTNLTIGNGTALWFYRRVGDSIQIKGSLGFGTTTSVTGLITFSLPAGLSIDSTKVEGDTGLGSGSTRFGLAIGHIAPRDYTGELYFASSTTLRLYGDNYSSTTTWNATFPGTWASGSQLQVTPTNSIPIAGWSSSAAVSQSDSSEGRVVAATYQTTNSTTSITTTATLIPSGWSQLADTFSAFDTSTGRYTAKVSGNYKVSCSFSLAQASYTLNQKCSAFVYVNGVSVARLAGFTAQASASFGPHLAGSLTVPVNAGDIIDVRLTSDVANVLSGTQVNNTVSFERLPGNQSITASESVNFRYNNQTGQTLNTGVISNVDFPTKEYDSHNGFRASAGAFNSATGVFATTQPAYIVPANGKYIFASNVFSSTWGTTAAGYIRLLISKNGTAVAIGENDAAVARRSALAVTQLDCIAGDVITVTLDNSTGGNASLSVATYSNVFWGSRVGN